MDKRKPDKILLLIAFFVPLLIAGILRFWDLDLRPFHSDEGVNTHFLLNLFNRNVYHYDPANYHGPFLYYIGLIPFYILGISDFSFRILPVLFGIMVVALLYPLKRRIGLAGLLTAGLCIAISPVFSFFSRDTIHETYLIFFSLAVVVSFFLYYETRKWRYILFGSASIAFTVTVKETYIITFAIYGLSLAIAYFCDIVFIKKQNRLQMFKEVFVSFGSECLRRKYIVIIGVAIFIFINFLFFSSFFTYYAGVKGILSTLMIWTKTGTHEAGGHAKPFVYYFKILYKYELPMFVMGIGGFYYMYRDRRRFSIFIGSWTVLVYVIYSLIPYKTPWLILNTLLPLSIMAGFFVNGITRDMKRRWHYVSFYPVYVAIFGFMLYQSIIINFYEYDDDRCELVYVQTQRDVYNLMDTIDILAETGGKDMVINVVAESYWPLPWYFRDYENIRFWGKLIDNPNAPVILADKKSDEELKKKLSGKYETKRFVLRPSTWIIVYIQKGLYDSAFSNENDLERKAESIVAVTESEVSPGLISYYYDNAGFQGAPFLSEIEKKPISFAYHDISKKPYRSPFTIEWKGYIYIGQKGSYKFATKSDDGSNIYIDGELVVDNGGFHAQRYISGIIFLTEGYHHFKIDYFDGGGGAILELMWAKPGQLDEETLIPLDVLFHKKTEQ